MKWELGGAGVLQRRGAGEGPALRLLGGWQLLVDGVDVPLNRREQRLVALLGLTGRNARAHVAGTLWPESTDARALASLRRAVLQTQRRCPGLLRADRAEVGLDPAVTVDVEELRRAARLTEQPLPGGDAATLLAVLVGEPLLPAWYDDWVLPERERLEQLRVSAFERIARHALGKGDPQQVIEAARAALDVEPLLESASELTIRAHLTRGDRAGALREFHRHRDALREELAVAPSAAILALVEPVLAGEAPDPGARAGAAGAGMRPGRPVTVPGAGRFDDLHVPITPVTQAAIPPPDPKRRTRAGPAPPVMTPVPAGADGAEAPRVRGVWAMLLAAAVLVLAASLALASGDVGSPRGRPDVTGGALLPTGVPAPGARGGPGAVDRPAPARLVVVRPTVAASGSAALLVRATRRPATVRVRVRGPEGDVRRSIVVRSQDGHRMVLDGLDPGTYRWWVTSPTAAPVTGRVLVAGAPPAPVPVVPAAATAPAPTTVSRVPAATPSPTSTPAPSPTSTPAPSSPAPSSGPTGQLATTTAPSTPVPQPTHPPPTPAEQPSPTGGPTDPGTQAPTPVG